MKLIIGGAYQGKLSYALGHLGVTPEDVFDCQGPEIDFSKPCIYHLERYVLACVREGIDPKARFLDHRTLWRDSVLIIEDIFCGVVPLEPENRAWREATGRLAGFLSGEAASVTRMFCGIPSTLKA